MNPKTSPELQYQSQFSENREKLKKGFGVAFCTKQKDGGISTFENNLTQAEALSLNSVQFDFRNRTSDEISAATESLLRYRETHPDVAISIHGETPKIEESTFGYKNMARSIAELDLLQEISGESYTVHPPSINHKLFNDIPDAAREKIIHNYANMFAAAIKKSILNGKKFSLGIENMPTKGDEGSWGQNIEDILFLVKEIEQAIIRLEIDSELAQGYLGVTLDVNHALHGAEPGEYVSILNKWFEGLGKYLKVVHLYTPAVPGKDFEEKYKLSLELASRFNPNARLFMETKQNSAITERLYSVAKQIV